MELPDFKDFEPFNRLRQAMDTSTFGYFEIFDPKFHLTGVERSDLDRRGLSIPLTQLQQLLDFTIVYKNTRVLAESESVYHVAVCDDFPNNAAEVRICTSPHAFSHPLAICRKCLQKLQYKGYDDMKARKEAYSQQVFEKFSLKEFWLTHHLYPVSEKRELRKPLV